MSSCTKKFDQPSVKEILLLSVVELLVLNLIVYMIFTVVFKKPYTELFGKIWVILVFSPLLSGILQPVINRNGSLTIEGTVEPELLQKSVAGFIRQFEYIEIAKEAETTSYAHRLKWERTIFKGKIKMKIGKDSLQIEGKKNLLDRIETKLIFGKEFKDFKIKRML